ncbi:MAG: hypothetical protein H5T84_09100, partial [Thermoleophilia bacterium]|nr:hypothetical protein [Thermoleophilia bacterium]
MGKRFLRLDRNVAGYARLSPSIRREFLTYTLLGWQGQEAELAKRRETLTAEIREVSESKRRLAHQVATTILAGLKEQDTFQEHVCFILAGDVVYGMAHRVPRPERSTGRMVQGSDLDIVVITSDDIAPELVKQLDEAILQRKHFLLVNPGYREEIDYLVKNMATVHRQLAFDTFEHMVACKILAEGEFLAGSKKLMEEVQTLLDQHGILDRLAQLEQAAK